MSSSNDCYVPSSGDRTLWNFFHLHCILLVLSLCRSYSGNHILSWMYFSCCIKKMLSSNGHSGPHNLTSSFCNITWIPKGIQIEATTVMYNELKCRGYITVVPRPSCALHLQCNSDMQGSWNNSLLNKWCWGIWLIISRKKYTNIALNFLCFTQSNNSLKCNIWKEQENGRTT